MIAYVMINYYDYQIYKTMKTQSAMSDQTAVLQKLQIYAIFI